MERKSMGSLIAALRKVKGLTQRDLAEQLHVSDKSISRWERDEGAPDLSLIPVLAEFFGVTCDELLRGERQADGAAPEETGKSEKQRRHLLALGLSKYRNRSLLGAGLAGLGLLAALLCNFGFHRAYLGFFCGAAFFLAAILCQIGCMNAAFFAVSGEEAGVEGERFKQSVLSLGEKAISLSLVLLAATLPLVLYSTDAYLGLTAESWLRTALPLALAAGVLCALGCTLLTAALQKRGVYVLPEKDVAAERQKLRRKGRYALILTLLLAATLFAGAAAAGFGDVSAVAEGEAFGDYASFRAYMEQDIPAEDKDAMPAAPERTAPSEEAQYYDEQEREIGREEALRRSITNAADEVVCSYVARNESVWGIRWGHADGSVLPITVFTQENIRAAMQEIGRIKAVTALFCAAELFALGFFYFRKRSS